MADTRSHLARLDATRWRIAIALTVAMTTVYVVFILLIAYDKPLLGTVLVPGLSLGILLGALVIVTAWLLIFVYVRWANTHYDGPINEMRRTRAASAEASAGRGARR